MKKITLLTLSALAFFSASNAMMGPGHPYFNDAHKAAQERVEKLQNAITTAEKEGMSTKKLKRKLEIAKKELDEAIAKAPK